MLQKYYEHKEHVQEYIKRFSKSIIWSRYRDWLGQMTNDSSFRILFLTYFRALLNSYRFTNRLKLVILVKYHFLPECCYCTALYTHTFTHIQSLMRTFVRDLGVATGPFWRKVKWYLIKNDTFHVSKT